ncbi:MAG: hypothetical protein JXR54_08600 [Tannerellaceae bacterium]|nr:hypothetical protein [Tannerellaceae bacterium]
MGYRRPAIHLDSTQTVAVRKAAYPFSLTETEPTFTALSKGYLLNGKTGYGFFLDSAS